MNEHKMINVKGTGPAAKAGSRRTEVSVWHWKKITAPRDGSAFGGSPTRSRAKPQKKEEKEKTMGKTNETNSTQASYEIPNTIPHEMLWTQTDDTPNKSSIVPECPYCGSTSGQWRGQRAYKNKTVHRRSCNDCGHWTEKINQNQEVNDHALQ